MQTTTAGTIRLARTAGIPEGTGREFKVGERYIAVFCSEGHFYAIEDECPHAGAPLNDGTVHKGIVTCLRHGWRFDVREGRCVNFTASPPVATFPVAIQGEDIYVTLPACRSVPKVLKAEGVVAEARVQSTSHVLAPMLSSPALPRHLTWQGCCRSMTAVRRASTQDVVAARTITMTGGSQWRWCAA